MPTAEKHFIEKIKFDQDFVVCRSCGTSILGTPSSNISWSRNPASHRPLPVHDCPEPTASRSPHSIARLATPQPNNGTDLLARDAIPLHQVSSRGFKTNSP